MRARSINAISLAPTVKILSAILLALFISAAKISAHSQQNDPSNGQPSNASKEYVGPSADTIRPYKPAGRDPFKRAIKPRPNQKNKTAKMPGFPLLEARRAEFRQKAEMARARDLPEPNPVTQYLVSEIDVTGIFRDERGFGAFVRAQPTGTTFFIRHGTPLYNGEVLRIEGDEADVGGAKVVFREVSYVEVNGKQSPQERVLAKLPIIPDKK